MKKAKMTEKTEGLGIALGKGLILCILIIAALLAVFALLVSEGAVSGGFMPILASAAIFAGSFAYGVASVKKKRFAAILHGLMCGAIISAAMLLVGSLSINAFSLKGGALLNIAAAFLGSVLGALVGNGKKRRR